MMRANDFEPWLKPPRRFVSVVNVSAHVGAVVPIPAGQQSLFYIFYYFIIFCHFLLFKNRVKLVKLLILFYWGSQGLLHFGRR